MGRWAVRVELESEIEEACFRSRSRALAVIGSLLCEYRNRAERISMLDTSTGRLVSFTLPQRHTIDVEGHISSWQTRTAVEPVGPDREPAGILNVFRRFARSSFGRATRA